MSDPVVLTEKRSDVMSEIHELTLGVTETTGDLSIPTVTVTTFEGSPEAGQSIELIFAKASLLIDVVALTDTGVEETSRKTPFAFTISCQPAAAFVLVCH